jgi:hypothetical protein
MDNIGTRLEVTPELNQLLDDKLEELKSKGAKGLTKKILLERLCQAGLEYQKNGGHEAAFKGHSDDIGINYPPKA